MASMKINMLRATSALFVTLAAPAMAQEAPAAPADETKADDGSGIDEIIVTARRREESLQSAPITVTAFSGDQLEQKGITDFSRLAQATPGINFDAFPKAAPRPFFRGVGSSNQGAGGDPSSVAFLDGVYLGRAAMLGIDFYPLEKRRTLLGDDRYLLPRCGQLRADRRIVRTGAARGRRTLRGVGKQRAPISAAVDPCVQDQLSAHRGAGIAG